MSDSSGLGSLSQAARGKQLKTARGILLFIGIITVLFNGGFYFFIEHQIDQEFSAEIARLQARGMVVDSAQVAELKATAVRTAQLMTGAAIILGVIFIWLGIIVKRSPVPVTISALVLYIGANAIFGVLNPMTLLQGIIIKIIIIVALFKSLQAALAYQREEEELARQVTMGGGEASPLGQELA